MAPRLRVGVCGWCKPQATVFKELRLLEDQRTFYQPPRLATAKRWRAAAPGDFVFTVKAWQLVTHEPSSPTYRRARVRIAERDEAKYGFLRPTQEVRGAWERSLEVADALGAAFVVLQCPARFGATGGNIRNLRAFVRAAGKARRLAWEPRGAWEPALVARLCDELGLVHATDPFAMPCQTERVRYFRLHGKPPGPRMYAYTYTDKDLEALLAHCEGAQEAWVLFNNHTMFEDALRFRALARERGLEAA